MKKQVTLVAVFLALLACRGYGSQTGEKKDNPAQAESSELDGPWVEVHALAKEKPKGPGEFYAWIFQGERVARRHFQTQNGEPVISSDNVGTYRLSTSAKPSTIDIVLGFPLGGNWKYKGIYVLEGDNLKLCLGKDERPTTFENKDDNQLYVLKRPPKD